MVQHIGVLANTLLHIGVGNLIATDGEASVVDQMDANLDLNFMDTAANKNSEQGRRGLSQSGACHVLKWGEEADLFSLPPFLGSSSGDDEREKLSPGRGGGGGGDVIFATDVVFGDKREVWRALGSTLSQACQHRRNRLQTEQLGHADSDPDPSSSSSQKVPSKQQTLVLIAQVCLSLSPRHCMLTHPYASCLLCTIVF
jgi:hypothetical protein